MKKKVIVKKLYTGLSDDEIRKKSITTLCCSLITVIAALSMLFIKQKGLSVLHGEYVWVDSVMSVAAAVTIIIAVFCLVGHFTLYRLKKEIYETQRSSLKGEWHTFAGLEFQFLIFAAFALFETFLLVRWFDVATLIATLIIVGAAVAAWVIRSITFNAFKNLSETPIEKKADESESEQLVADEEVEDFYDK